MSSAIIKFEDNPEKLIYWKDHAYPAGLGFKLLDFYVNKNGENPFNDTSLFEYVTEIPKDIQYEYIIQKDNNIHCQESWWAKDKSYHGGGLRHGGIYNLKEWQRKLELQKQYTYRRKEAWGN